MSDPVEPTRSSPLPMPLLYVRPVPGSTLELSQPSMEGFLPLGTMGPQPELPIAHIPSPSLVSVRCTLKLMSSPTPRATEQRWRDVRSTLQTRPAIHALASLLMREYHPWFSIVSIEIRRASYSWLT